LEVFVHKDLNFWPEYFSVLLTENNNKMNENYVQKIWVKKVVVLGWFHFWQVFVQKVLYFGYKHCLTVLMRNNIKMIENNVRMV